MTAGVLYTLGHGNRTQQELFAMLFEAGIATLVDVRAVPRSKRNPQFDEDALRATCPQAGIIYHQAGRQLGGLRTTLPDSPHAALDPTLRGFADHMQTEGFRKAAAQLTAMAAKTPTAILCAERDPARCHRGLIADYLILQGMQVVHLIAPGESHEHLLNPAARRESAALIYDARIPGRH